MTVIVTRDVADRFRGFLASCALEIAPGVYTAPRMTKSVRLRVWAVLAEWFGALPRGSIIMTWLDASEPCGQGILTLGLPPKQLHDLDGLQLVVRGQPAQRTPPGDAPPSKPDSNHGKDGSDA